MKIEPHENGPLFVEMNFYLRTAKQEMIEDFRKKKSLKSFGMPVLRGSGNHLFKGDKYLQRNIDIGDPGGLHSSDEGIAHGQD